MKQALCLNWKYDEKNILSQTISWRGHVQIQIQVQDRANIDTISWDGANTNTNTWEGANTNTWDGANTNANTWDGANTKI